MTSVAEAVCSAATGIFLLACAKGHFTSSQPTGHSVSFTQAIEQKRIRRSLGARHWGQYEGSTPLAFAAAGFTVASADGGSGEGTRACSSPDTVIFVTTLI
jgi:hypothetical protein